MLGENYAPLVIPNNHQSNLKFEVIFTDFFYKMMISML